MKRGKLLLGVLGVALAMAAVWPFSAVHADTIPSDFNLQVTPSPLVTTVKPGAKSQLELKVHNAGSGTENLKIELRSFTYDSANGRVNLEDTTPPAVASWVSFSQPKFTIASGQWFTEQINLNVPKDAGFSYSFAVMVSRQANPTPTGSQHAITGSLAVFTLLNVDRPGASSNLAISSFSVSKHLYEYLPATFSIRFRNNGNTIAQPFGNVFIERGSSKSPLGSLTVNEAKGYILPDTERNFSTTWDDGFPSYQTIHNPDGSTSQKLAWNWTKLSSLRIGRYTAHLVAVYNQGGRDVPIEGTVSFWVIPWKILLVLLAIVLLVLFAVFMIVRNIVRGIKRQKQKRAEKKAAKSKTPPSTPDGGTNA